MVCAAAGAAPTASTATTRIAKMPIRAPRFERTDPRYDPAPAISRRAAWDAGWRASYPHRRMRLRRLSRLVAVLALVAGFLVAIAAPAWAHATLETSSP